MLGNSNVYTEQDIKMENFVTGELTDISRLFYKSSILISKPNKVNKEANATFDLKNKM